MRSVYESGIFTSGDGMAMHPGGLRLTDRAARLAALAPGMRLADIGCGDGTTAAFLASKYQLLVTGLEISEALVAAGLEKHPGLELIPWHGGTFPFEDGHLDAAVIECVLSVAGRPEPILRECARCLKNGGTLILSDVVLKREGAHPGLFTAEGLSRLLTECGFEVGVCEDHIPALRTYLAELREYGARCGSPVDAGALLGACLPSVPRLAELGYALLIARKAEAW